MTPRVATLADVAEVCADLAAAPRLSIDTEFHTEGRYKPELLLVQVGTPTTAWLLDPLVPGLLAAVAPAILASDWLVHAGGHDLPLLSDALGGVSSRVLDTQLAAALAGARYPASLAELCRRWIGVNPDKGATLSDWSKRPLDAEQITYAAEDVVHLPALWDTLLADAERLGRGRLVLAACEEARSSALSPPDPRERWRELVQGFDPEPVEAAVLSALIAWRDGRAARMEKPPHFVVGDATLRHVARARPTTVDKLAANRRISANIVERWGRDLVRTVSEVADADPSTWPTPLRRDSPAARTADLLDLATLLDAADRTYAARLALPRALSEAIAADHLAGHPAPTARLGWRTTLVGDLVADVLAGYTTIAMGAQGPHLVRAPRATS